MKNKIY